MATDSPTVSPTVELFGDCNEDRDCPDFQLCYSADFPWVSNSSEGNICDCNAWFGWIGEDCSELGPGSVVFLSSVLFSGLMGLIGIVLSVHTLLLLLNCIQNKNLNSSNNRKKSSFDRRKSSFDRRSPNVQEQQRKTTEGTLTVSSDVKNTLKKNKKPLKKKTNFNSVNVTSIFVVFAFISFTLWRIALIVVIFTPEEFSLREEDTITGLAKAHFIEIDIEKYLVLVTGVFLCLSLLNLALVWIDNVKKIRTLTPNNESKVFYLSRFLIALQILWFIAFFFLPPAAQAGAVILLMLTSSISYYLAVRYMQNLFISLYGDLPKRSKQEEEGAVVPKRRSLVSSSYWLEVLLNRMIKARRRIVIGAVIGISGSIVYLALSINNSWREYSEPGKVSLPMVGNEALSFGLGFSLLAVCLFLHDTANRPLKSTST